MEKHFSVQSNTNSASELKNQLRQPYQTGTGFMARGVF